MCRWTDRSYPARRNDTRMHFVFKTTIVVLEFGSKSTELTFTLFVEQIQKDLLN